MAKAKGPASVQNRHIYTRASYLYQAAHYLSREANKQPSKDSPEATTTQNDNKQANSTQNLSRQLVRDFRAVSLKSLVRQSPAIKQTLCKMCDTLLVEGQTCRSTVENTSKGGKKSWADILVMRCLTCGHVKRFPVAAPRQKRKPARDQAATKVAASEAQSNGSLPDT